MQKAWPMTMSGGSHILFRLLSRASTEARSNECSLNEGNGWTPPVKFSDREWEVYSSNREHCWRGMVCNEKLNSLRTETRFHRGGGSPLSCTTLPHATTTKVSLHTGVTLNLLWAEIPEHKLPGHSHVTGSVTNPLDVKSHVEVVR